MRASRRGMGDSLRASIDHWPGRFGQPDRRLSRTFRVENAFARSDMTRAKDGTITKIVRYCRWVHRHIHSEVFVHLAA
ncbi:hypothetical protein SPHV1_2260010 [Novosphingobium sp. KN65.2]|nr:hypothetical protein SPHV1_2260010 [Novosphingobium sp. KN65.2]